MNVRLPDGRLVKNVPEGTTQEELMARLQAYEAAQKAPKAGGLPGGPESLVPPPDAPGNVRHALGEIARGSVDVLGGGAQLLSRGAHSLGLVPESNPDSIFAGPKDVEAQNAQARRNIERFAGPGGDGFSPVRAGAAALLTMPMTPIKFLQAPTAVERGFGAGVAGGVAGGLQEVQDPKSNKDFWARKGLQAGVGFGAGAISQPLAESVVKHVVSVVNKGADKAVAGARNLTGANSGEQLVHLTREALKRSGIDFDALDEAAKAGLLDDVQKALGEYSGVNPAAVARQAAFRAERFDPLRHWISKDPAEFTSLENLSHQPAGDVLKQKKADLDAHVQGRIAGMRGDAPVPSEVGARAKGDLAAYLQGEEGKTNVLYRTFREIAPDVKGQPQRFANDVFGGLEGQMAGAALPANLREIVNKISGGEIPLTPDVLFQLQKMAKPGADGTSNYAIGHLRRAIDRELDAISKGIGAMDRSLPVVPGTKVPSAEGRHAADVLKMARKQAAKVFGEVEESKFLSGNVEPEKFVDSLMGSSLRELAATWTKLGKDAKEGMRAQVLEGLRRKAFGAATEESGKAASQATFMREINDPTTQQKLTIILGKPKVQEINRLGLMLESAHLQPAGSAVNNSKTGGAILGAFSRGAEAMKAKNIPGGSFAQDAAQRGAAQAAQQMIPGAMGQQSLVIDPLVEELLKRRVGHGAGLLGAISGYPALTGLLGN